MQQILSTHILRGPKRKTGRVSTQNFPDEVQVLPLTMDHFSTPEHVFYKDLMRNYATSSSAEEMCSSWALAKTWDCSFSSMERPEIVQQEESPLLDKLGDVLSMVQDNCLAPNSTSSFEYAVQNEEYLNPRPIDCNRMSIVEYVPMEISLKQLTRNHADVLDPSFEILSRMFGDQDSGDVQVSSKPEDVFSFPISSSQKKRGMEVVVNLDLPLMSSPPNKRKRTESKKLPKVEASDGREFDSDNSTRNLQAEPWYEKYQELCEFHKKYKHCNVPPNYKNDSSLWRWVKRQRYHYKLKRDGKPSSMTEERIAALNAIGLIWDSQGTLWMERFAELRNYMRVNGHCNVPSRFNPNPQLSTWVKVRL